MQIVINIPDEVYELCAKDAYFFYRETDILRQAIKNGTPLPKGHGRIIDERQITKCTQVGLAITDDAVTRCLVTDAPTIIEAEKQSLKQIRRNRQMRGNG